jgi:hypothetical protein
MLQPVGERDRAGGDLELADGQVSVRDCALVAIDTSTICACEQSSVDVFDSKTFNSLALLSLSSGDMSAASVGSEHGHLPFLCKFLLVSRIALN